MDCITPGFPVCHQLPVACSNSCPSSRWCHPTTSSSVVPFSSCLQSCPASGCFPVSQFFASGGKSIAASASASVLPMNIQGWFPLGCTIWSPWSPRDSQESPPTAKFKSINSSVLSFLYSPTLTSIHVGTTEYQNVQKLMYESGENESVSYSVMPNSLQPHEL